MSTLAENLANVPTGIPIDDGISLHADIVVPRNATGVVLFAHGSGSGRDSPRNRFVAGQLNALQIATVVADLLTPYETEVDARSGGRRRDIPMLTGRLVQMIDWARSHKPFAELSIGLFGASTGAAVALNAAAQRPDAVRAIISGGGRSDLATHLGDVKAPTLLIAGRDDPSVLQMNRVAICRLRCKKELKIIPGATHLFAELGALEMVASSTAAWFQRYLRSGRHCHGLTSIDAGQWETFADHFSEQHDRWSASFHIRRPDGHINVYVDQRPFRGVTFRDGSPDAFILLAGENPDDFVAHIVDRPTKVVAFGEEGDCSLLIESEDGGGCLLRVATPLSAGESD
jgi:putative phosphoribosyl transferase